MTALFTHFLPGLVVGFIVNGSLTWLQRRANGAAKHTMDETKTPGTAAIGRRRARPIWLRLLALLCVTAVILTIGSAVLVFQRQDEAARRQAAIAACVQRVADTTSRRLNEAAATAKEDRKAVDDMVAGVITPGPPGHALKVLQTYLKVRAANDATRAKRPPYPTTDRCSKGP